MSERIEVALVVGVFGAIESIAVVLALLSLRHLNPAVPQAGRFALFRIWPPRATFTEAGWRLRAQALMLQGIALVWLLGGVYWLARARP
jgi:hypothetical protein